MGVATEDAAGENHGPQTAPALERLLRPGMKRLVHPIAGSALAGAAKPQPLDFEFTANERIQVHAAHDDIPPENVRPAVPHAELRAQRIIDLAREKRDLPLVVVLPPEKPVAANPHPR